jgi:hypothetical protein
MVQSALVGAQKRVKVFGVKVAQANFVIVFRQMFNNNISHATIKRTLHGVNINHERFRH